MPIAHVLGTLIYIHVHVLWFLYPGQCEHVTYLTSSLSLLVNSAVTEDFTEYYMHVYMYVYSNTCSVLCVV